MPSGTAQVYQASVNPSRRAKVQSSTNTSMLPSPPLDPVSLSPSLPPSTMTTTAAAPSSTTTPSQAPAHQPSKRGRKPNPLSRSARETQRKLNHSIIEKARRTKINEALAELRTLVPANWGREGSAGNAKDNDDDLEDDDEGEDGEDDAEYNPRSTTETRSGGKRQSRKDSTGGQNAGGKAGEGGGGGGKEKEFKLEILERTVGYLKKVIGRARELEREVEALRAGAKTAATTTRNPREDRDGCSRCSGQDILERQRGYEANRQNEKRKRASLSEEEEEQEREERPSKRFQPISSPALSSASTSSDIDIETPAVAVQSRSRLPSISSWLPSASSGAARASTSPAIDPILFTHPRSRSGSTSPRAHAYLPSPPSSTQFNPIHVHPSIGLPPKLNLSGPIVVSPAMSKRGTSKEPAPSAIGMGSMSKGGMTPEDEFAASSLLGLQIGMERRRRSGSLVGSYGTSGLRSTSSEESPSSESLSASLGERGRERRVQTPGSLLGLIHPVRRD